MSIAIIISTHGSLSEQLLNTTEMILGKQNNVTWVNFSPEENLKTLIAKYETHIEKLNTDSGLLFLVDIWGGSPFNAAKQLMINKNNYDIITGVNIPMLIEIFMTQDDYPTLKKLVQIAINNGRSAIKHTNDEITIQPIPTFSDNISPTANNHHHNTNQIPENNIKKHMTIGLARIDDRLIHGQVVTRWTKESKIQRIIVINDEVANDIIRKTLLTQVSPPGVTAHVISVSKAIRVYNNPKYAQDRVMLLFTNPTDIVRLIKEGVTIRSVNIGGMAYKKGKQQINNAVSVDQKDINAFKTLHKFGIELEIRKVTSDTPINIMDLINKLKK